MVLIPEEAIQRYEQRQRLETSLLMSTMMHKDTQISDILQRDDVPDDEKQKLFNAYFERFLELRRQKETPTLVKKEEQRVEQQLPDADVVGLIPITMRPRATVLLSRLKAKPDVITWDKTGQVKIEGETIPGSNISDLVSDAMRFRKNFNPTGSKEFFQVLSKMNVPKDLVRNEERWKEVLGETSGTLATPKLSVRSSPQFRKIPKSYEEKGTPISADRYPALNKLLEGTPKRWEKY